MVLWHRLPQFTWVLMYICVKHQECAGQFCCPWVTAATGLPVFLVYVA